MGPRHEWTVIKLGDGGGWVLSRRAGGAGSRLRTPPIQIGWRQLVRRGPGTPLQRIDRDPNRHRLIWATLANSGANLVKFRELCPTLERFFLQFGAHVTVTPMLGELGRFRHEAGPSANLAHKIGRLFGHSSAKLASLGLLSTIFRRFLPIPERFPPMRRLRVSSTDCVLVPEWYFTARVGGFRGAIMQMRPTRDTQPPHSSWVVFRPALPHGPTSSTDLGHNELDIDNGCSSWTTFGTMLAKLCKL